MNFLTPLFLLGAAAIAGPILYHLIRRTTRDRVPFSSLLFLEPSPPRITRRSRLEDLLLLVLRCAAIGLVALAFARPYLRQPTPPSDPASAVMRSVLLIDTSASMRRSGLWSETLRKASDRIRGTAPSDALAILAFDRGVRTILSFDQWREAPAESRVAMALEAVNRLSPSWNSSALGPALIRAVDDLSGAENAAVSPRRRILLISDLQEGARLDPLQSFEWPRDIELIPDLVRPTKPGNASLQWIAEAPDSDRNAEPVVRVRVVNSPDARSERFQIGWATPTGDALATTPLDVYVPPGQSRVVQVPVPAQAQGVTRIVLRGDDEPFDNTLHILPPQPVSLPVVYIGPDTNAVPREPLFFLQRALPDSRRQTVRLTAFSPASNPSDETLGAARLIVVSGPIDETLARRLKGGIDRGWTVVFVAQSSGCAPTLARLLGLPAVDLGDERPPSYALLGEIDFRHPLLAPFADPRFSDFTRIHWWRYRRFNSPLPDTARVIARFDSGAPAWIDFPAGRGRLLFLASGWSITDSQFALSSKFIPWLYAVLDLAGAAVTPNLHPIVGDEIPLPSGRTVPLPLRLPGGTVTNLPVALARFSGTDEPGMYAFESPAGRFGVNLDPAEGRTAPLPIDRLESMGVRLDAALSSTAVAVRPQGIPPAVEAEGRQKLWRWIILTALVLLLVESFIAGWRARRTASLSSVPTPSPVTP